MVSISLGFIVGDGRPFPVHEIPLVTSKPPTRTNQRDGVPSPPMYGTLRHLNVLSSSSGWMTTTVEVRSHPETHPPTSLNPPDPKGYVCDVRK